MQTTPPAAYRAPTAAVKTSTRTRPAARPKAKTKTKASRTGAAKGVVKQALRPLAREEATSTDTMLLMGGLALFVLVLADTVFLTLSTRVLRVR